MHRSPLEFLEQRKLFSVSTFSFANFASTAGLALNGYNGAAQTSNNALLLTDGAPSEARSVLYTTPVDIGTFTSHFRYTPSSSGNASAGDGLTFVIDNGAITDLGSSGGDLGYGNGTFGAQSVAIAMDFYDPSTGAGTHFAFAQGGQTPPVMENLMPVDFHNNDSVNATVTYDGTTLSIDIVDVSDPNKTFHEAEAINLPSVLGSTSALIGFTGGTGNAVATQAIDSWDLNATAPSGPVFTGAASGTALNSAGTKDRLSASVADSTGSNVSYSWSTVRIPSGAPAPRLSVNNSASAANTVAQYFKDGTYHFRVTATDSNGATATSDVDVVVSQVATGLRLSPHKAVIPRRGTRQFSGYTYDQFGRLFRSTPTTTFAIASGPGTISSGGLFSAGTTAGHVVIRVTVDELTGTVGAVVS